MKIPYGECPFGEGIARIEAYPDGTFALSLMNADRSPRPVEESQLALGWVLALVASGGNLTSALALAPEVARRWGPGVMGIYRWILNHRRVHAAA